MSQINAAARTLHRIALGAALAALPWIAQAQFAMVPPPECKQPRESPQADEKKFKVDAARHLYSCYPARIYKGKLPPLLYGVMVVNVELDAKGNVVNVNTIRPPAAAEVAPWVESMVRKASPFPAPVRMAEARFTEIFLVDKSGRFQTDSLTEGQR